MTLNAESRRDREGAADAAAIAGLLRTNALKLVGLYGSYERKLGGKAGAVVFSSDGRLVASGSDDYRIRIWDAATGALWQTLRGHENPVRAVAFSPDGRTLLSGADSGDPASLRLWDLARGREVWRRTAHCRVTAVAFSPDGRLAASGGGNDDGRVKLWDVATWNELRTLEHDEGDPEDSEVTWLAFAPDGRSLLMAGQWLKQDGGEWNHWRGIELWDAANGTPAWGAGVEARRAAFSPDGRCVIACPVQHTGEGPRMSVRIGDSASGREARAIEGHDAVAASKRGALATGQLAFAPFRLELRHVESGRETRLDEGLGVVLAADRPYGEGLAFSPDGRWALLAGERLALWDLAAGSVVWTTPKDPPVTAVAVSPDGHRMAVGSEDGAIVLREVASGRELCNYQGDSAVDAVAFSADGQRVWSGGSDHVLRQVDPESGRELRAIRAGSPITWPARAVAPRREVVFSADARLALVANQDQSVALWDLASGRELRRLEGHAGLVTWVGFSGDGRRALSCSQDKTVRVWDVATGQLVRVLEAHRFGAWAAGSSDGCRVVSAGNPAGGEVILWETETSTQIAVLEPQRGASFVAVSPDGGLALTAEWQEVKLWDAGTGRHLDTISLADAADQPECVAFAPDGRWLVVGTRLGVLLRFERLDRPGARG